MADAYTDEALSRLSPATRMQTERDMALLNEAKLRANEAQAGRSQWHLQRDADREFVQHQFTDLQRSWRRQTERPVIQIHMLETRVEQVLHDWRASETGFRVGSRTGKGGEDAARIFNGLAARDQRESDFNRVMHDVVEDGITFGEGWGKVVAVKASDMLEQDRPWDGEQWSVKGALGMLERDLKFKRVPMEDVWPDPHAMEHDRSDMEWLIETRWISREKRDARWPNARKVPVNSFDAGDRTMRQWFNVGGPMRDEMCRIALYWRRRWVEQDYVFLPDWEVPVRRDRLTADQKFEVEAAGDAVIVERERAPIVELTVLDGSTILAGPIRQPVTRIPYFRVVGKEVRYSNGEMVPRGLVALLRGPSKWMSVTASDVAWKQSTTGVTSAVMSPEALSGHEEDWDNQANPPLVKFANEYERFPSEGGERKQLRPPVFMQAQHNFAEETGIISMLAGLMATVGGSADANQRIEGEAARSGAAIRGVSAMESANRSRWMYDAHNNGVMTAARIWFDWAVPTYGGQTGRKIYVASESPGDPDEGALVGVPFFHDPTSGEPVAWPWVAAHVDRIPLPPRLPDGTWVTPPMQLAMGGGAAMPLTEGAPPAAPPPGPGAAPPVQPTVMIHRFNPLTDRVKLTTFSSGIVKLGADATAQFAQSLLPVAGPAAPALLKQTVKAVSTILPVDGLVKEVEAIDPTPPDLGDMDVGTLAAHLRIERMRTRELEQRLEQAAAAADQTQAAREIEAMKAEQRSETAKAVAEIRSATALAVAEIRRETATETTEAEVEQRREQVVIENAAAVQVSGDKEAGKAAVAGLQAGLKAGEDDGRRGEAGG